VSLRDCNISNVHREKNDDIAKVSFLSIYSFIHLLNYVFIYLLILL